ncbi:hypothetical protein ACHAXS_013205 [Conticribra weissflogii]
MTKNFKPNKPSRFKNPCPIIRLSATMMTMLVSIFSHRSYAAAFTTLPIKTMTSRRRHVSHPDVRLVTMGVIISSLPSSFPFQNLRHLHRIDLRRSDNSGTSSFSLTNSRRRRNFFNIRSRSATALNSIRGGSIDDDDIITTSTKALNEPSPKNINILPLPPSLRRRNDDVNAALLAALAACRVTCSLQPDGTLFQTNNSDDNNDAIYNDNNNNNNNITTLSKQDASPVTIGDFASQAMALQILKTYFPQDVYLAEEGSEALRSEEGLLDLVWEAVHAVCDGSWVYGRHHRPRGEETVWEGKEGLLEAIDFGRGITDESTSGTTTSRKRVWALDPIDGTKGFLRGRLSGGQYCVALALIEDGVPIVSVLGCPNLPTAPNKYNHINEQNNRNDRNADGKGPYGAWTEEEVEESEKAIMASASTTVGSQKQLFSETRGCLFVAARGCGCFEIPLHALERSILDENPTSVSNTEHDGNNNGPWTRLDATSIDIEGTTGITTDAKRTPSQATFCLGVERSFSDPKGTVLEIAKRIHGPGGVVAGEDGVPDIVNSLRMDGQVKYGLLARGEAQYFVRLPKEGYVDWIWDVAAGYVVLTEAGGRMTDVFGEEIDFSEIGVEGKAKLPESVRGIFGSCGGVVFHDALVDAYSEVEGGRR